MSDLRISPASLARDIAQKNRRAVAKTDDRVAILEADIQDLRALVASMYEALSQAGIVTPV